MSKTGRYIGAHTVKSLGRSGLDYYADHDHPFAPPKKDKETKNKLSRKEWRKLWAKARTAKQRRADGKKTKEQPSESEEANKPRRVIRAWRAKS